MCKQLNVTAHREETMATWMEISVERGFRYLKLLLNVPLEGRDGGVEPPALDEDGAAPVLVRVDPRVGGEEGAAAAAQQRRPRVADGRDLADARGLGQEERPRDERVPDPPLRGRAEGGLGGGHGGGGGQGQVSDGGGRGPGARARQGDRVRAESKPKNERFSLTF